MAANTLPQERCDFYVYVIFRPNGVPCYVGKGCGGRWRRHIRTSHNQRLGKIFAKYGTELPIVIVREGLLEDKAFEIERALIAAIGRDDLGTGPLVNLSGGGEGASNPSDSFRQAVRNRFLGKSLSEEHKEKVSSALKGRSDFNLAGRKASPVFQKGTPLPRDILEKMRATKTGVPLTPETIRKMVAARIGRPLSAQHRDSISRGNKGIPKPTPFEARERIAATMKAKNLKWWCTPEGIAYRSNIALSLLDIPGRKLKGQCV